MTELEWRRTYKTDLNAKAWKYLAIDDEFFLFKSIFKEDSYEILITDLTEFWYEKLQKDAIEKRSKKLNPSVEAPVSKLLEHIKDNMEEKEAELSITYKDKNEDKYILLSLSTKLAGLSFLWKFNGKPATKQMVADHMTLPLLTMVNELLRQKRELSTLLRKKDNEIADLKAQGIRTSRKQLETVLFDEKAFKNTMVLSKGFAEEARMCGRGGFSIEGQELYRDLVIKQAWFSRTPDAEVEGGTFVEDGVRAAVGDTGQSWSGRIPTSLKPGVSPQKSPAVSPTKPHITPDNSPAKDAEMLRRRALEKRLVEEEEKKELKEQKKKKKKIKF